MCHLILMMPLLALPVFWLWPLDVAGPAYAGVVGISVWIYYLTIKAMHRPVETGQEALLHSTGEVIAADGQSARVRMRSEIWEAMCSEPLHTGDRVEILAINGLVLRVQRLHR